MSLDTRADDNGLFIPPEGLAFRIFGYVSQRVIYSRTHQQPEVGHIVFSQVYPDQWFTLVHGTESHKDLYAIKSKNTGKVLFARKDPEPRVGHIDGDGKHEDNWFKFEPGKGQYAKYFRLITPFNDMALVSRTSQEPELWCHEASYIHPDQHFGFLFEDMQIDTIKYDLDVGRIISSTPRLIGTKEKENDTDVVQEDTLVFTESISTTNTFEYVGGFTIAIGMEFSASVPLVAEGKITESQSVDSHWKWAESTTRTITITENLSVKAGPHTKVRGTATLSLGRIDVPFTVYLSSKSTGVKVETKGKWTGITHWDVRSTYSQTPITKAVH